MGLFGTHWLVQIWQGGRGKLQPQLWAQPEVQRACECVCKASDVICGCALKLQLAKRSDSPPRIQYDPGFVSINHQVLM